MSTSTSKTPTPRKRAGTSPAAKTPKATRSAVKKVPSPAEVPPGSAAQAMSENTSPITGPEMKKQELLKKVVELSGIKKKDAKPVVEAMLEVLGETLADGRGLNLQPFGKLKLNRTKETPNARIIVAKLRQSKAAKKPDASDNQTVAAAAE